MNRTAVAVVPLFVVIPLAAAFVNSLLGPRRRVLSDALTGLSAALLLALALATVALTTTEAPLVYTVGGWPIPIGIALVLDGLSVFMLVTLNLVALASAVYARDYMRRYTDRTLFNSLLLLMLAGLNGVIVAGDLFNLFVFLEIASVASYGLVAFGTGRRELEAAFKYAVMATLAALFILLGIVLLYGLTSTLNMADMGRVLAERGDSDLLLMVSVLFIMGFGLKAALVPFHAWLPDAHPAAPAPISALLSGVLIKSLGVYALCRIFYGIIGISPLAASVFMFLGAVSMMVGVLAAFGQRDLKRLLAYSSISQVGYIVFALGLGTPLGILGAVFHLFNHAAAKALLFLAAGATEYATGVRDLRALGGLSKRMPVTAATGFCAALSIAGVPPFGGFWSKLIIIVAAVQAGYLGYALWAVIVSVLTLALFAYVMKQAFFGALRRRWRQVREVPRAMRAAMLALVVVCVSGGLLLLPAVRPMFLQPAVAVVGNGTGYSGIVLGDIRP